MASMDGQDAVAFLLGGDGSGEGGSALRLGLGLRGGLGRGGWHAGTGGFAADVEDVGSLVEEGEAVGDGGLGD